MTIILFIILITEMHDGFTKFTAMFFSWLTFSGRQLFETDLTLVTSDDKYIDDGDIAVDEAFFEQEVDDLDLDAEEIELVANMPRNQDFCYILIIVREIVCQNHRVNVYIHQSTSHQTIGQATARSL
jgi:hypothetical protein